MTFTNIKEKFDGPIFTVFTAFKDDLTIDYESIKNYIQYLYDGGAKVFYVMPYNSRYSQLSEQEIYDLNKFCIQTTKSIDKNNIIIVADPIHCSTETSLQFTKHAKEFGADAISLIVREKYFSDDQILDHFRYIGKETNFPIVVHEMPFLSKQGNQINWPKTLLEGLKTIPEIIAIKEDAKDEEMAKFILKLQPDIRIIFAATKRNIVPLKKYGLKSYLNGLSIIDARIGIRFWEAWNTNDYDTINYILENAEDLFFLGPVKKYGWHMCNKALLQSAGLMNRIDRMPMPTLDDVRYLEIVECYSQIKKNIEKIL
jgi:4-hydroxy-tetrahydrodipicolinate synthase